MQYSQSPPQEGAWPFLISKGRTLSERVMLAPAFLIDGRRYRGLTRDVATGGRPEPAAPGYLRRQASWDPDYEIVYGVVSIPSRTVGESGQVLVDADRREVTPTVGLVVRENLPVDEALLAAALDAAGQALRWFWYHDSEDAEPLVGPLLVPGESVTVLGTEVPKGRPPAVVRSPQSKLEPPAAPLVSPPTGNEQAAAERSTPASEISMRMTLIIAGLILIIGIGIGIGIDHLLRPH